MHEYQWPTDWPPGINRYSNRQLGLKRQSGLLNYSARGSGNGASLSMEALLGEPGGEAPLLGALKVMIGMLWGQQSLFMGAQLGNLVWAHLLGTLRYG
jgi:hypothetical protein